MDTPACRPPPHTVPGDVVTFTSALRHPTFRAALMTMAWIGFSTSLIETLLVSLLSGAGTGLLSPPVNAAVADVLARPGGAAGGGGTLAGFQMLGDVGAVLGPILAGLVVDLGGYQLAFTAVAIVTMTSFGVWRTAPETLPRAALQLEWEGPAAHRRPNLLP